ncbi:MAG: hypothetical protein GX549_02775 [Clostridiales bacterium]|nr:hypothetical protein [Clostridiales bacterium]
MDGALITAAPMDAAAVARIEEKLSGQTGYPVKLIVEVDPALIAGFVVALGHHRYDYSARTQLMDIRKHLLNG